MANIAKIMQHWFGPYPDHVTPPAWGAYPDNYLYFDLETTGFSKSTDLVVEVGWAVVRDRQIVDNGAVILDWTRDPRTNPAWLHDRMEKVRYHMAEKARTYHYSSERLRREGMPPDDVLDGFYQLLQEAVDRNDLIMAHNGWSFDIPMLASHFHRFRHGLSLNWHDYALFDTGLVEKAAQMNRVPWIGDTLDSWSRRVAAPPFKAKWALDTHVVPKYRLAERFQLDTRQAHGAGYDCVAGYHFFETLRDIGEGRYQEPEE